MKFYYYFLFLCLIVKNTSAEFYTYEKIEELPKRSLPVYKEYLSWPTGQEKSAHDYEEKIAPEEVSELIDACINHAKASWVTMLHHKKIEYYSKEEFQGLVDDAYSRLKADWAIALRLYIRRLSSNIKDEGKRLFFDLMRKKAQNARQTGKAMIEFLREQEQLYLKQRNELEKKRQRYQEIETKKIATRSSGLEQEVLLYEDEYRELREQEAALEEQIQTAVGAVRNKGAFFMYQPSIQEDEATEIARLAKERFSSFPLRIKPFLGNLALDYFFRS